MILEKYELINLLYKIINDMNFILKKRYGQNFLMSREFAKKFVDVAEIKNNDTIIEIGTGLGMITQYLLDTSEKVISIEIDSRFINMLENRFKNEMQKGKLVIINQDFLKLNLKSFNLNKYKVIGSLPYNISKRIIKILLEYDIKPKDMTFIIQNEVALDYTKKAPKATFLSNYAKIFSDVKLFSIIPKTEFKPMPKVDGAIIKFIIKESKINIDKPEFVQFLKTSFINPRKKLLNNLSKIYKIGKDKIIEIFNEINIDKNSRAANLEFEQWINLYKRFNLLPKDNNI